jgi:hypothetical protein
MGKQLDMFGQEVGLKELKRTKAEVFEDYSTFVDKFETKKTTDDCYTPPKVYDAVRDFVHREVCNLDGKTIVRPFFPGGDFENFEYPENCVVIDNPPFSIMAKIVRFYTANNVPFFLFAPALTLFTGQGGTWDKTTAIVCGVNIRYENKADVCTSFITNMLPDVGVWVCPQLVDAIKEAQAEPDKTKRKFVYPDNIITAATIQKLAQYGEELVIHRRSCVHINDSDSCKAQGRSLFGGGFLLSERAAAERAAAERASAERAAAERAAATKLLLSERERRIIASLE